MQLAQSPFESKQLLINMTKTWNMFTPALVVTDWTMFICTIYRKGCQHMSIHTSSKFCDMEEKHYSKLSQKNNSMERTHQFIYIHVLPKYVGIDKKHHSLWETQHTFCSNTKEDRWREIGNIKFIFIFHHNEKSSSKYFQYSFV